jgi:homoserine kinase type II
MPATAQAAHHAAVAHARSRAGDASAGAASSAQASAGGHETFARDELARVLSHYDLGIIEALEDFPRGSRKAPKLVLKAEAGRFLLKRRARGRGGEDQNKVAFCHDIQQTLAAQAFPLPNLVPDRRKQTMLVLDGRIYELFEFIPGEGYNQSLDSTGDAGRVLGLYHKLLADFDTPFDPPTGSYHAAASVEQGFDRVLQHFAGKTYVEGNCRFLLDSYLHARDSANDAGLDEWPSQVVHGDWHPGNMLFRQGRVAAVIDYDSARFLPRIIDAANGALQFSILGGGEDLSSWPEYPDQARFKRFLRGYDNVNLLSEAEVKSVPWLMIEALIAEAVFPIAATGQFGKLEGAGFLDMVKRKVVWFQKHADALVEVAAQ